MCPVNLRSVLTWGPGGDINVKPSREFVPSRSVSQDAIGVRTLRLLWPRGTPLLC